MPKIKAANFPDVDFVPSIEVEHQLWQHTLESYVMSIESFITFLLKYTKSVAGIISMSLPFASIWSNCCGNMKNLLFVIASQPWNHSLSFLKNIKLLTESAESTVNT
jgi:hypothetical protein